MNVNQLSENLSLPVSTISFNVRILEKAGLISTELQPASRGTMKVCTRNFDDIHMDLNMATGYNNPKNSYQIEMPVGHYIDSEIHPTCGLINTNGILKPEDEPSLFYHPERMSAQLIWFRKGYVKYRFPFLVPADAKLESIQFSVELCSEAPRYDHDWPSDITVSINGNEVCTWTCPGDFGDRRGRLNPHWVPSMHTQYGLLKTWKVNEKGTFLDDIKVSDVTLEDLHLKGEKSVSFKIGVKADASNIGGINLFGKGFGDHDQDILMRLIYS